MRSARIYCPSCGEVAPTETWGDIARQKYESWSGILDIDYEELKEQTGSEVWGDEPKDHGYRRVRRCLRCSGLVYTVEVDEAVVREVVRLRQEVRHVRQLVTTVKGEAAEVAKAASAIKQLLK